jgi:RNA polymerase sigma factor (sigma-70 family)
VDAAERRRRWQVVLPHRQYLVRIALSRGMSREDAEDCAQEAMVRCVGFAGLDETRVQAFLATTTARLCVDRYRVHAHDTRVGVKLGPWYLDEPSPEEATCDRSEASWVARHVESLPAQQRAALVAKAEGLSGVEIAARMGLSYKAVESLLSRARAYVRAAVATVWVLAARARRLPEDAPAMTMAALVTVAAFVPGGPLAPRRDASAADRTATVTATVGAAVVPSAPAALRRAAPAATRLPVPPPPERLPTPVVPRRPGPLPAPPPVVCDTKVPHVDTCIPLDKWVPGEGVENCLENGVEVTGQGANCPPSKI